MDKKQILAIAGEPSAYSDAFGDANRSKDEQYQWPLFSDTQVLKLFESYKAELLKKVGAPVAWLYESKQGHRLISDQRRCVHAYDSETRLYVSDQVAAAIIKATKPLEERIQRRMDDIRLQAERQVAIEDKCRDLSAQLAAAQEEIASMRGTVEELTRKYKEHAGAKYAFQDQLAKAEQLRTAYKSACAFIDSHVADPDITNEMAVLYESFCNYRKQVEQSAPANGASS